MYLFLQAETYLHLSVLETFHWSKLCNFVRNKH